MAERMKDPRRETRKLKFTQSHLHTYALIDPSRLPGSAGPVVDCGFNVWKTVPVKDNKDLPDAKFITSRKNKNSFNIKPAEGINKTQMYTYKAYIE